MNPASHILAKDIYFRVKSVWKALISLKLDTGR